jgi:penicillin-binding protein 1B
LLTGILSAAQARDRVLTQMFENKYITDADVQDAKNMQLKLVRSAISGNEAPYFVDMVKDHLLEKYSEQDLLSSNYRVFTTLDPQFAACRCGRPRRRRENVDAMLAAKYAKTHKPKTKKAEPVQLPTGGVALIALDPRTGKSRRSSAEEITGRAS